jgi:hypothetical protein
MPIKLATMTQMTPAHDKPGTQVLGHDIPRVRPTPLGIFWVFVYLIFPVLMIGNLLDLAFQFFLGWCIGVWCIFPS